MDELLTKYMLGEATADEIEAVDKWVFANDTNLKYFTHFKLIWEASRGLKTESNLDIEASWGEFKQMTQQAGQPADNIRTLHPYRKWMKIAAIWITVLGVTFLFYTFLQPGSPKMVNLQSFNTVKTDTLSDGSVITLNKDALLSYPERFTGATREIRLNRGEAFFNIAHDRSKPFIIHINDAIVKVVGTSFNIKNNSSGAEIIVETGIVQVIHKKVVVRLQPKEKADIDYQSDKITKGLSTDKLYNYYRTQELIADKTPLWKMVKVLNNIFHVNIVIADKKIANRLLTTKFKLDSLDRILNVISQTLDVRIVHEPNRIIIFEKK